ncbi:MAG: DUF2330 domain-containing protein [Myxococcota bacterium]
MWLGLWMLVAPAEACGGLVCDAVQPVVQEGERVVFEIDGEAGVVEMHVQVAYEGPAEDFGWIVPVGGEPELFVSPQFLFDTLGPATSPTFVMNQVDEGNCRDQSRRLRLTGVASFDQSAGESGLEPPPATVISQAEVGPYDATILRAQTTTALRTFLDDNAYAIPTELDTVLEPYVTDEAYFVAIKLRKDRSAGDIAPLGLRYPGTKASIPIQLTAIAVADDMPLEVYVFGDTRTVPESYLHVKINEAAVDWWLGGVNYFDVVRRAADEAGGQAFATDYYGAPPARTSEIPSDLTFRLRNAPSREQWAEAVASGLGVFLDPGAFSVIADLLDISPFYTLDDFRSCPGCVLDPTEDPFDPEALTTAFEEELLLDLVRSLELFDAPLVTRLTSSLSADEMTVDPVFVLNADMRDELVDNVRTADLVTECRPNRRRWKARRRLDLADGRSLRLPSTEDLGFGEELDFLSEQGVIAAQVIERTAATGMPVVEVDFTVELEELADRHNRSVGRGCAGWRGCSTTDPAGLGATSLLLALVVARRRRRTPV